MAALIDYLSNLNRTDTIWIVGGITAAAGSLAVLRYLNRRENKTTAISNETRVV
jgi:hypothetical protein